VLILGTLILVIGGAVMVATIFTLPSLGRQMQAVQPPNAPPMPAAAMYVGVIVAVLVSLLIYIVIPGIYVWFFRLDDVRRTVEYYDPVERWTDRCPLPVLGMSVACALLAVGTLSALIFLVMPVFGVILTGLPAAAVVLAITVLFAAASVLLFRCNPAGWWLAIALLVVLQLSTLVTAFRIDVSKLYSAMGMTPEQERVMQYNVWTDPVMTGVMGGVMLVVGLIYALRVKKYFNPESGGANRGLPA
jgi:hypothetical protein